jgi:hypothetical protein
MPASDTRQAGHGDDLTAAAGSGLVRRLTIEEHVATVANALDALRPELD